MPLMPLMAAVCFCDEVHVTAQKVATANVMLDGLWTVVQECHLYH